MAEEFTCKKCGSRWPTDYCPICQASITREGPSIKPGAGSPALKPTVEDKKASATPAPTSPPPEGPIDGPESEANIPNRIEIRRGGKRIGFLEVPEVPHPQGALPNLEGNERGFAIVVEIEDAPAVALIFPWRGQSIDIAEPVRWSAATRAERDVPVEQQEFTQRTTLRGSPSLFQLAGEIRPSHREAEERFAFKFIFGGASEVRRIPIRLEIDDAGDYGSLHFHLEGEPLDGRAVFRGSFHSRPGEGDLRAEMFFDFRGSRHGFGEVYFSGRIRSRESPESSRGEFRFWFDALGPGRAYGEGRFEGRGSGDFALPWLIEQTLARTREAERRIGFRVWVGPVLYSSARAAALLSAEARPVSRAPYAAPAPSLTLVPALLAAVLEALAALRSALHRWRRGIAVCLAVLLTVAAIQWWKQKKPKPEPPPRPVELLAAAAARIEDRMRRTEPNVSLNEGEYDLACVKDLISARLQALGYLISTPTFDSFDRMVTHERESVAEMYPNARRFERSLVEVRLVHRDGVCHAFFSVAGAQRRREADRSEEEEIELKYVDAYRDKIVSQIDFTPCKKGTSPAQLIFFEMDRGCLDVVIVPAGTASSGQLFDSIQTWGARTNFSIILSHAGGRHIPFSQHSASALILVGVSSNEVSEVEIRSAPSQRDLYVGQISSVDQNTRLEEHWPLLHIGKANVHFSHLTYRTTESGPTNYFRFNYDFKANRFAPKGQFDPKP